MLSERIMDGERRLWTSWHKSSFRMYPWSPAYGFSYYQEKSIWGCSKRHPEGRKKAAPVGLQGGEDQVEETLGQRKSPMNVYWLLLFTSNTQLCFIFPGPIFWTSEPNERQAIFLCFHLDWEYQVSKGRIISRLLWKLCLEISHSAIIYHSAPTDAYTTRQTRPSSLLRKMCHLVLWPNDPILALETMKGWFEFGIPIVWPL